MSRRRIFCLAACLLFGAGWTLRAQQTSAARTEEELRSQMEAYLAQPKYSAALWGVKVVSLDSGKTVFEHHADRLMSPASNSKLYTGALGLMRLGGDYRLATPVYARGKIGRFGTLHGNLIVLGEGDASWNPRRLGTNFWAVFEPFVAIITNAGVRRVSGDLVADATFFRGPPTGSGWAVDDVDGGDTGFLSALTVDDNIAQVKVAPGAGVGARCRITPVQPGTGLLFSNETTTVAAGEPDSLETYRPPESEVIHLRGGLAAGGPAQILDVAVPKPADWFARAFKIALERAGVKVSGRARGVSWPESGTGVPPVISTNEQTGAVEPNGPDSRATFRLGTVYSPPLRDVVRLFMKPSQNLEADTLLADVGELKRESNAPPGQTSESAGLAAMGRFLDDTGVAPGDVRFDEGSGLSRNNLTTANATVALLRYMDIHGEAEDFLSALPVAGVDGTLRRRLRGTPAAGNVQAKTGTLRWTYALSGHVTSAAGERLAFSFMLNRFAPPSGHSGHEELDSLVLMLANFAGRSDTLPAQAWRPYGTLLVTQFVSAPFPHPARADGHRYHDEFYSAGAHYSDSTVAMFIPKDFRPEEKVDFVVHFHGWRHTVGTTLEQYQLLDQFARAGRNAILIVPQGPRNAPDSFGGKLEDTNGFKLFLAEAMDKLSASGALPGASHEVGRVILSGHSGGYHVMAAILDHGGLSDKIKETWVFDALYGQTGNFVAWQKQENGRLVDIYTDHGGTREETENLMAAYRTNGVPFFAAEETNAVADNLRTNRIVFLHTDLVHDDVVSKRGEFGEFLSTSCLEDAKIPPP